VDIKDQKKLLANAIKPASKGPRGLPAESGNRLEQGYNVVLITVCIDIHIITQFTIYSLNYKYYRLFLIYVDFIGPADKFS
jgi:hypothetical protein